MVARCAVTTEEVESQHGYRDTVAAADRSDPLVQTFTDAIGHCNFTTDQILESVAAGDLPT